MNYPFIIPDITEPCNEKWEAMTPNDKGRFCALCDKTVVDFTSMSYEEIIQTLQNKEGRLCARSHPSLLKQKLREKQNRPKVNRAFFITPKPWMVSTLLVASMVLGTAQPMPTFHNFISPVEIQSVIKSNAGVKATIPTTEDWVVLKGKVVSENKPKGLEDVKVVFLTRYKEFITYTNAKGTYELEVPKEYIKEKNVLYFETTKANEKRREELKEQYDGGYFEDVYQVIPKNELTEYKVEIIKYTHPVMGLIYGGESKYLVNGEEISEEEYYNQSVKGKSCDFNATNHYSLWGEAAEIIYGKSLDVREIRNGKEFTYKLSLTLIFDSTDNIDTHVF